ncbi:MAG: hypothetical protein JNM89_00655 [Hyphomicrobiaceae bacterium]|nr:hypothetical protein [Hyphomicrobiaceae bacterium]
MTSPRSLRIAVTGHRPNRLHIGTDETQRRVASVLAMLLAVSRAPRAIAISALAEGADRIFADCALARGMRLEVLLPFASEDYETTFSDAEATPHYRSLLARAQRITTLSGSLADSKAAFEAVGHATVETADILVAVWDGKPAAGRGGTPEIISYALARAKPVILIDAARSHLPRLVSGARAPVLSRTAPGTNAVPLTPRALASLSIRRAIARTPATCR